MSKVKSRLRQVVTSSTIKRASLDDSLVNQSHDVPSYAPFDEPDKYITNQNRGEEDVDFKYLSKTELKILQAICEMVLEDSSVTRPVYLQQLSEDLGNPVSTLKKTIQKLEKKKIILRSEFKSGRGGWTCYTVPISVRVKLEIN